MFVDWRSVKAIFCGLMWFIVLVLAVVIIVHGMPPSPGVHHLTHDPVR